MDSHFAPAERAGEDELALDIDLIQGDDVLEGVLQSMSGVLAILNEHRQVVALNDSFLKMVGIDDPEGQLGLRMGEVMRCDHAEEEPAGCGTTEVCSSCGAAIAIVSSLSENRSVERTCALKANRGGQQVNMSLLVRSHPLAIEGRRFLLLILQDVTQMQQRASLERAFFHDINNMLTMLLGSSRLLLEEQPGERSQAVFDVAFRLHREVAIQQRLLAGNSHVYKPFWQETTAGRILDELESYVGYHEAAEGVKIEIDRGHSDAALSTDVSLVFRVVFNMVVNALEATEAGGSIRIRVEPEYGNLVFCVWNQEAIPEELTGRIFQRNFSTKEQVGRGVGTYAMKLFGEDILGGKMEFTSCESDGTTFRFACPVNGERS